MKLKKTNDRYSRGIQTFNRFDIRKLEIGRYEVMPVSIMGFNGTVEIVEKGSAVVIRDSSIAGKHCHVEHPDGKK